MEIDGTFDSGENMCTIISIMCRNCQNKIGMFKKIETNCFFLEYWMERRNQSYRK